MAEVDVALPLPPIHIVHFLEEVDDKVSLLPAVADPADVSHVSSLVLVAGRVWLDTINPADDAADDGQRILAILLFSGN